MLDESLRLRLEALNRERLPVPARPVVVVPQRAAETPLPAADRPAKQVDWLARGIEVATPLGCHLLIAIPLDELWPQGPQLVGQRAEFLCGASGLDAAWHPLVAALPDRVLLLDLETCGLGGSALFLVGLARSHEGVWRVELLFARNYAEEAAVLWTMWQRLVGHELLVTFNGKSFDWPTVLDRSRRWLIDRQQTLVTPPHLDVLHAARRRWRGVLPDCRLQTIERSICRRVRTGDIPSREIPAAYDEFVRQGANPAIESILYHNALDLVTLLDVTLRLAG